MPVVMIAAPPHPESGALLSGVADAIADSLGLGDGDVIVAHVPTGEYRLSGGAPTEPWPVVTIHGRDRGAVPTAQACAAAEGAVRAWAEILGVALGGVWVTWVPSVP